MRRKNLLKELGIQKQADTSCNALDIDTENVRQRVYAKLDFADTERKQTTMRSKKKILPLLIAATLTIGVTAVAATGKISMWTSSSASRGLRIFPDSDNKSQPCPLPPALSVPPYPEYPAILQTPKNRLRLY